MSPTPAVGAVEVVESPRSSSLDLVAAPPAPAAEGATPAESQPTGNRRRRKVKSTTPLPAMSQGHAEKSTSSAVPAPTQVTQSTTAIATPRAVSSSTKTSSIMAAYRAKQGLSAPASPAADIAKDILAKLAAGNASRPSSESAARRRCGASAAQRSGHSDAIGHTACIRASSCPGADGADCVRTDRIVRTGRTGEAQTGQT
jgi:hypothetical protein